MAMPLAACKTGDLKNNVDKLRQELLQSKYAGPIDVRIWRNGNPSDLLPLIHFALLGYSANVRDSLVSKGYDLFAKTDIRFLEAAYKLLRQEFGYLPLLRVEQFFAEGFAERKVILVHDIIKLCQRRHADMQRDAKASHRDNASGRAYAVHRGSALSSLASSNSANSRPLVERGPPAGGKKLGLFTKQNLRGSGERLTVEVEPAFVLDDFDGLQPRAMRPPAPHPIISAHKPLQPAASACAHLAGLGLDWSDSQQVDYATEQPGAACGTQAEQMIAALNFTAAVHTSVSPKHPAKKETVDYSGGWTQQREQLEEEREQLEKALNFTAAVHTSVSPKVCVVCVF